MNQLNVSLQHSILTLAAHGWSQRRIGRELGVHRETVGKYLRLAQSKPAISTLGSDADLSPKPAISTPGSPTGRQSLCQPWAAQIEAAIQVGLSAQRIYQDLVGQYAFPGSYQAVKRFVRQVRQAQPIPFMRMEVEPGTEAQVDFGQGAWVWVNGKRKRPHLFRVTLSHSRKGYSEVVWRQTTENFIRCLENAFRSFGGVPRTLVIDNLRAAVTRADWYDPELNAKVEEFCRHYGTVVLPTRPAMPHHKGKIEAGRVWSLVKLSLPKTPRTKKARQQRVAGFEFELLKDKLREVFKREGRYLLRTNLKESDPAKVWAFYLQLVEVEEAFKNLKGDLCIRPIFHQLERRIEAHIFVCFLAYCLQVTLRHQLRAKAPGLTVRQVLEKFGRMQMMDVHFPTTDGRELVFVRYTQPETDQQLLLAQMNWELPPQSPPRITAKGDLENGYRPLPAKA